MVEEANNRLKQALEAIEDELDEYRIVAINTENRYAVIGGVIGLVGGLVGVLATAALGAIIAKDLGGSWGDVARDYIYVRVTAEGLDLTPEQEEALLKNRRTLKTFEQQLATARLTSSDYYRIRCAYESFELIDLED
jgi:hypothetical protein